MLGLLLMDVQKRLAQVLREGKAGNRTQNQAQAKKGGGRGEKAKGHRGIGGDRDKEDATRWNN